jgi:hypothetical protein
MEEIGDLIMIQQLLMVMAHNMMVLLILGLLILVFLA